jgi:glycosyltransferase involved in cell wall biosynthesis
VKVSIPHNLVYLSGAPRVSTRPEAEASGPRAHILGVIDAFRENGWNVEPYIVGDRVPIDWIKGSEKKLGESVLKRLAADFVRVAMGEWNARKARKLLGERCDWVYERFGVYQMLGRHFKRCGIPWIVETNGALFHEAKAERSSIALVQWARRRELRVYREADVLITITEALKEIIVDAARVPADKIIVVPNGVDTSRFNPATAVPRRIYAEPTIGLVANLFRWHALDLLIDAVSELDSEGIAFNIVVVGDGLMRTEWESHAHSLGFGERTAFFGQVPWSDIPSLIAGFDLCYSGQVNLQIGKMYHSPLKLYEYMAMGKPVVASAFEDSRRVVRPDETGFLFEGGNKESLKRTLRSAWKARSRWKIMGEAARELVVREHSWKQRVRTMIGQIEEVLARV